MSDAYDNDDLDFDIVSDTYRSIVDQDAFDDLIAKWNTKLNALDCQSSEKGDLFSKEFLRQLDTANKTLDALDIPVDNNPLERLVSEVPGPAIVMGPDLRVAASNQHGDSAFNTTTGAFFDRDKIDPSYLQYFDALVRAANGQGNTSQSVVHINSSAVDIASFHAEAFLVRLQSQDKPYIALRTLELPWTERMSNKLKQAFGLTPAEIEVGRAFFALCDLAQVAAERQSSLHTVRTQMKLIMGKTGASNQADLIRLFAMVASRELRDQRGLPTKWSDPLGREVVINAPRGRKIAWTWMGHPEGTPTIFLRGLGMGYLLPPQAEKALHAHGIKLFVPSRPGYGNSSLHSELPVLEDNVTALREYLDEMDLGPCVAIGLSDGIIPILALQDQEPHRFRAIMSIGFNGCLNRDAVRRLPVAQSTLLGLAKTAPSILKLIAKLGLRMMQSYGMDWYLDRAHATVALDMKTSRAPETAALVRDACAHLAVQGIDTFVRDMQMFHAPVEEGIDRLTVPMTSLVPTHDGLYNAAEYRKLEARNSKVTVIPIEQSADLLMYQKTDEIIAHIIRTVRAQS